MNTTISIDCENKIITRNNPCDREFYYDFTYHARMENPEYLKFFPDPITLKETILWEEGDYRLIKYSLEVREGWRVEDAQVQSNV